MTSYALLPADTMLFHGFPRPAHHVRHTPVLTLHDYDDLEQARNQDFTGSLNKSDIDALVASGDYFGTLATSLDSLSQRLNAIGEDADHVALEKIINTLLYIETRYTIIKR